MKLVCSVSAIPREKVKKVNKFKNLRVSDAARKRLVAAEEAKAEMSNRSLRIRMG